MNAARNRIGRKFSLQPFENRLRFQLVTHYKGLNSPSSTGGDWPTDRHRHLHASLLSKQAFHFAQLHAVSPDFYLVVQSPQIAYWTGLVRPAHAIARSVIRLLLFRGNNKSSRGLFRILPVSEGKLGPGHQ